MEPSETQLPATITRAEIIPTDDVHTTLVVPALIADLGDAAGWRYVEFFTVNIRNPHTRRAYARACARFFAWCENRGLELAAIRPFDVAAYIEGLQQEHSAPGVKQQLAAIRMLFDWLITGQVLPTNPAAAVRPAGFALAVPHQQGGTRAGSTVLSTCLLIASLLSPAKLEGTRATRRLSSSRGARSGPPL